MKKRLNNLSSRLKINGWLVATGHKPIAADLSYVDYATELRKKIAPKMEQHPFVARPDAVAYIRYIASTLDVVGQ